MYKKIIPILTLLCFYGSGLMAQYCVPTSSYCGSGGEEIINVAFSTVNTSTSSCGVTSAGYSDYSAQPAAPLTIGQPYTITVILSSPFLGDSVFVWIDYNHNSTFDASELVATLSCYGNNTPQTCSASFTVPAGTTLGNTRLRARLSYTNDGDNNPCVGNTYGQAQDFTVNIANPVNVATAVMQPTNGNDVMIGYKDSTCSANINNTNQYSPLAYENTPMAWTFQGCFGIYRMLVNFADISNTAVIPATATIVSAKLVLPHLDTSVGNIGNSNYPGSPYNSSGSDIGWVYELANTFGITTVTWNTQPGWKHVDSTVLPQSVTRWHGNDTMDVTNMVIDMFNNVNTGFLIKIATEVQYRQQDFGSSRNPDATKHPALIVNYEIPCSGTPNAALISTSSPAAICNGSTQTIVATDPNPAGTQGISYQWQQSAASTGPWSNIAGATNLTYTTPALATTTYYRLVDSCANSHLLNASTVFTVNVLNTPTISAQPTDKTICAGANTSFSLAAAGGNLSYQWQVNTGSGFTNVNFGGVYGIPTTNTLNITGAPASMNGYIYQCVVSNICGSPLISGTATLHVNALPAIAIGGQPTNSVTCPGNNAIFSVTATGAGLSYIWKENGVALSNVGVYSGVTTSTLTITGATLAMNGRVYTCVVSGSCLPAVTTTNATLTVAIFTANATPIGATSFCSGASVELDANIITSANYQWQLNGGNISGATGTIYYASTIGDYSVNISTPNGCSATSTPVYIDVVPAPATPAITSTTPDTVCAGTPLTLQATPVPGLLYQWALNGVNIPGAISINYLVPVSGSGAYTVAVSNSYGCSDTSTVVNVVINTPPAPFVIIPEGPSSICLGSSVTLTSDASGAFTYQWYDNNNKIIGALAGSYNAPDSGNYSLVITDGNGCSTTSIPYHIVLDIVSPAIQLYNDMLCTDVYTSYQWFLDGNAIPGAISTCYVPAQNGHYSVWTTDDIGCGGMSNYIDIEDLAVNNISAANNFRIYPNPASSLIHIDAAVKINVSISDMEGKQISSYADPKEIDISQLASGIYMIHIYDENNLLLHTEKLVKTNW